MNQRKDLVELSAGELLASFASGATSVIQYADRVLERVDRFRWVNSFVSLDPDGVRRGARAADAALADGTAGPLCGLLVSCKDNIETAALPTKAGTPALGNRSTADAPAVHRLLEAGCLLLGKTNMHELAFGVTSNNAHTKPVRNPYDATRVPGGSSGGTAAAVAARLAPVGLATDTGGSARIPAALCGVVGFRPTTGRYPGGGCVPVSPTRDTIGIIARRVSDVILLDSVLADERSRIPRPALAGVRIGVPRGFFYEDLDPCVSEAVEGALSVVREHGAVLVEADLPQVGELDTAAGFPVSLYEARRDLGRYVEAAGLDFAYLVDRVSSPDVLDILVSLIQNPVDDKSYAVALGYVRELRRCYANYFVEHKVAAMAIPTVPLPAPPIGDDDTTLHNGRKVPVFPTLIRNTSPGSLGGVPGLSLPLSAPGAVSPVGIEFDGPRGQDLAVLALGVAVEEMLPAVAPPALEYPSKEGPGPGVRGARPSERADAGCHQRIKGEVKCLSED